MLSEYPIVNHIQQCITNLQKHPMNSTTIDAMHYLNIFHTTIKDQLNRKGNMKMLSLGLEYIDEHIIMNLFQVCSQPYTRGLEIYIDFIVSQLKVVISFLPHVYRKPQDSVFNTEQLPEQLHQCIQRHVVDAPDNIALQIASFYKRLDLGHAYVHAGSDHSNSFMQAIVKNSKALLYIANLEERRMAAIQALTQPTLEHVITLWRMIDTSILVKKAYKSQLDSIPNKKIVYIPRVFQSITLANLHNAGPNITSLPTNLLYQMSAVGIQKRTSDTQIRVRVMSSSQMFRSNVSTQQIGNIVNQIRDPQFDTLLKEPNQTIPQATKPNAMHFHCCVSPRERDQQRRQIKNVIIHFHGGGFISMTSFSHQVYTRQWVNSLEDTLIFSVDYRLAPENAFPCGLDDCWQVYMWIIHFASCYFLTQLENIILTGDSAGGNLAMGVMYRAIETKQRLPDKVLLLYPALNLNVYDFVPSFLKCLTDKLLPYNLLLLCLNSYMREGADCNSHYFSPLYASKSLISKLPNMFTIFVGDSDVLKDNSIEFIQKILLAKAGCRESLLESQDPSDTQQNMNISYPKLIIFDGMPHGFMNFRLDVLGAHNAGQRVIQQFKEYLI